MADCDHGVIPFVAVVQTRFEVEQAAHYLIFKCQVKSDLQIKKLLFFAAVDLFSVLQYLGFLLLFRYTISNFISLPSSACLL
ncbi:hypothetical protein RchiOBHm_Chr5g0061421 [Rosa chinensis]|uniref:Uncharacterized protein n=1 Tax=Rosa chinensis TaxID=74649 RepID=A0A2P6QHX7_ROSCH|nr:hypothetical protein RchiOBHm_Chr5g0061421 [Rosa chinensis]